jgi:hypothetical protein
MGGGNPILQSRKEVEGVEGVRFIADARFEDKRVHLRFGVDGEAGTEQAVWRVAQTLDHAITVDAFLQFVKNVPDNDPRELAKVFEAGGRGRPRAQGDWDKAIAAGKTAG